MQEMEELRFQKTGRKTVVAIKLNVIEGGSNAVPAGHSGGFGAADVGARDHDDVAESQRLVDQYNFEFERSAGCQMPGAEKINAGRTDIASDESDGKFFGNSLRGTKAQGKIQSSARIFTMFGMYAYGVRWHTDEAARLRRSEERGDAQRRDARSIGQRLRSSCGFTSFRGGFFRPRFNWSCALRCAHQALRDGTTQTLARTQQTKRPN